MPLAVRAGDLQISDGLAAMARGTDVYLPVRALALALEFPIDVDADAARASGWFLHPDRRFVIDAEQGRVSSEGESQRIAAAAVLTTYLEERRELYVRAEVLEQAWPVKLSISQADLALDVEPLEPLPAQQRRARQERHERLRARQRPKEPDLPAHAHGYGWLSPPVVGLDLQARSGGGARAARERLRWSQEIAGVNVAAGLFGSGPSLSESRVDSARLTLQRFAGDERWPGNLRWVAAGDVAGESFNRIGSVGTGRGITLSSFPLVRATAYDLYELEGSAPVGWQAELYRGGRLMDFQQVGRDGRYRFDGIELGYGVNRLRVVLHGPQGRTREGTEIVDVGQTEARPGKTHVRFDRVEDGRDFIEVGDENERAASPAGTSVRAVHGVSRGLSLEAGLIDLPAGRHNPASRYAIVGAAGAVGPTATRLRLLGQPDGGRGLDVDTRTRAGPFTVRLGLGAFDRLESPRLGYGHSALKEDLDLAASFPLSLGAARVRLGARYSYSSFVSGRERQRLKLSQRWNTGSVAWHHNVDIRRLGSSDPDWSADLDASDRWHLRGRRSLRWSAGLSYAQTVGITNARLQARYLWSRTMTLGVRLRRAHVSGHVSGHVDWTQRWDNAQLSLTLSGSERAGTRAGLRYSVGFGPSGGGSYTLAESQAPRGGSIAVLAFLDRDGDGTHDAGEPPVPNAQLQAPLRYDDSTDDEGRLVLHSLEPHRSYPVRLDPDSLDNPLWMPASEGRLVRVRPGSVPLIELPVQETASISGSLQLEATGAEAVGVPLELRDEAGAVMAETRSIFGGFFSFERIPYGRYEIAAGRGYAVAGERPSVTADSEHPMLSGLEFAVEPQATTGRDIDGDAATDAPAQGADAHDVVVITGDIPATSVEENRPVPGIGCACWTNVGR